MSRIGKKPVSIPAGVKVRHTPAARTVEVEGPKGRLTYTYHPIIDVDVAEADNQIVCTVPEERMGDGPTRAQWGTTRASIQNMITGVSTGYTKKLEIVGVGWNAKLMGKSLQLNVGYCHPIEMPIPAGITCTVEASVITITGFDKQSVGQFAAEIRDKRRPEPYNAKGIRYVGEIIIRKQGKAFGS